MTIAEKLGSRALQAEAKESLVCDLQDLTILIGLGYLPPPPSPLLFSSLSLSLSPFFSPPPLWLVVG